MFSYRDFAIFFSFYLLINDFYKTHIKTNQLPNPRFGVLL